MSEIKRDTTWDQWTDTCPKCHNRDCLTVFEVTIARTGDIVHQENPLCPDGFEVDSDEDDCSTEDEKVRCEECGEIFSLSDLALHKVE